MKILFLAFSTDKNKGGIENYCDKLIRVLTEIGHNVTICSMDNFIEIPNTNFIRIKKFPIIDRIILSLKIISSVNDKKYDLIICSNINLIKPANSLSQKNNCKFILLAHGIEVWGNNFANKIKYTSHLSKIITVSSFTSTELKKQGYTGAIFYLPPCINLNNNVKFKNKKNENDDLTILTVGRLSSKEKYKGHDTLIEVMNILVNQSNIHNIRYNIVGSGDDLIRIKKLIVKYNLKNYIRLLGFLDEKELLKQYNNCDVFAMPSRTTITKKCIEGEGFGIVFIEAASFGLPLIGPNSGGAVDIIEDGYNGFKCDPSNPIYIANLIIMLSNNRNYLKFLGKNAITTVENKYSEKIFLQRVSEII